MASKGYSIIKFFMHVPSESLNLMARIARMNLLIENLFIVDLVALPSAKRTHLLASKCLAEHFLIEVANEVYFCKRILR
jgi:hypothetical protein